MDKENYILAEKQAFVGLGILPEIFHFHNINHTKEVLEAVNRLSGLERINGNELLLLKTAAAYHDTGYICNYQNHEEAGVRLVREVLPSFDYTRDDIKIISDIIMATKMPQNPKTRLQKIICDADLDNFGRKDFFIKGALLKLELKDHGVDISQEKWYEQSLKLLEEHSYFTKSARRLRQKGKEENINKLKKLLEE
jgi:exopolyphosphatase/pppGpp-phosphohydrolase